MRSTAGPGRKNNSSDVFLKVRHKNKPEIKFSADNYGDLIRAMVRKFAGSSEDEKSLTLEIFLNIWRHAAQSEQTDFDELLSLTIAARRQLSRYPRKSESVNQTISM